MDKTQKDDLPVLSKTGWWLPQGLLIIPRSYERDEKVHRDGKKLEQNQQRREPIRWNTPRVKSPTFWGILRERTIVVI
jgi:hypothetical protein